MEYKTVKGEACGEFIEKRSRFICHGKHVTSQAEAEAYICSTRSKYWDAKHNVYAYCIRNDNIKKSSDDGEPRGTAGAQILMKLEKLYLQDVVVIVTRYFGGILLGTGGLVRAYSYGAEMAVNLCGTVKMKLCVVIKVKISYNIFGKAEVIIRDFNCVIKECMYNELVDFLIYVEEDKFADLKEALNEISSGRVKLSICGKGFFCMD